MPLPTLALRPAALCLGLLCSVSGYASDEYADFISLHVGSTGSSTQDFGTSGSVDLASGSSLSLAYGFEEKDLRVLLELNQTQMDVTLNDTGSLTSYSLFYNVYWAPDFNYDLSALVGAGVGYSQNDVKGLRIGTQETDLSDTGWSAKLSLGVEYSINRDFAVNLMFHQWITDALEDDTQANSRIDALDHTEFALGGSYRF
jgi:opacity protein-like surface antigen